MPSLLPAAQRMPCETGALLVVLHPTSGAAQPEALGPNSAFAGCAFPWLLELPAAPALFPGLGAAFACGLRGGVPGCVYPYPCFTRWTPWGRPPNRPESSQAATYPSRLWSHGAGLMGPGPPPLEGAGWGRTSEDPGSPSPSDPSLSHPGVLTLPRFCGLPVAPAQTPGLGAKFTLRLRYEVPGLFTPGPAPPGGLLRDGCSTDPGRAGSRPIP